MKWIIQFLLGESRLLELWNGAGENPVVQLFDPERRGRWMKFVYQWLAVALPVGCVVLAYSPTFLTSNFGWDDIFGNAFGFITASTFVGAVVLPLFGVVVLRGRIHEREGLEQLCLTPLTRDEISFGAVYWPIQFTYRTLRLLFIFALVSALLAAIADIGSSYNGFTRAKVEEAVLMIPVVGLAMTICFLSVAFSAIIVCVRAALACHGGRWPLLYRVPLTMIPHGFWMMGALIGSFTIMFLPGIDIFGSPRSDLRNAIQSIVAIAFGASLVKFQLTYLTRRICFDGPSLYFDPIREPGEPQPIWAKAEWAVWRSKTARKQVLADVEADPDRATRFESISAVGLAFGFFVQAIVVVHALVIAMPPRWYDQASLSNTLLNRFAWMGWSPGIAFVFPVVVWILWWAVYGRLRDEGNCPRVSRDAPFLGSIYRMRRHRLVWGIPLLALAPCALSLIAEGTSVAEATVSIVLWALFLRAGFWLACVVALQVHVSPRPQRAAMTWLALSFVFVLVSGYRDSPTAYTVWQFNDDIAYTVMTAMFMFGSAMIYLLPVLGHTARHRAEDSASKVDLVPELSAAPSECPTA